MEIQSLSKIEELRYLINKLECEMLMMNTDQMTKWSDADLTTGNKYIVKYSYGEWSEINLKTDTAANYTNLVYGDTKGMVDFVIPFITGNREFSYFYKFGLNDDCECYDGIEYRSWTSGVSEDFKIFPEFQKPKILKKVDGTFGEGLPEGSPAGLFRWTYILEMRLALERIANILYFGDSEKAKKFIGAFFRDTSDISGIMKEANITNSTSNFTDKILIQGNEINTIRDLKGTFVYITKNEEPIWEGVYGRLDYTKVSSYLSPTDMPADFPVSYLIMEPFPEGGSEAFILNSGGEMWKWLQDYNYISEVYDPPFFRQLKIESINYVVKVNNIEYFFDSNVELASGTEIREDLESLKNFQVLSYFVWNEGTENSWSDWNFFLANEEYFDTDSGNIPITDEYGNLKIIKDNLWKTLDTQDKILEYYPDGELPKITLSNCKNFIGYRNCWIEEIRRCIETLNNPKKLLFWNDLQTNLFGEEKDNLNYDNYPGIIGFTTIDREINVQQRLTGIEDTSTYKQIGTDEEGVPEFARWNYDSNTVFFEQPERYSTVHQQTNSFTVNLTLAYYTLSNNGHSRYLKSISINDGHNFLPCFVDIYRPSWDWSNPYY